MGGSRKPLYMFPQEKKNAVYGIVDITPRLCSITQSQNQSAFCLQHTPWPLCEENLIRCCKKAAVPEEGIIGEPVPSQNTPHWH